MPTGTVKFFDTGKGFGFIKSDDGSADVFFHVSAMPEGVIPNQGDRVAYEVGFDRKSGRERAENVRLAGNDAR